LLLGAVYLLRKEKIKMTKKLLACLIICFTLLSVLAACGGSASGTSSTNATGPNQVHMGDSDFKQASITIQKGQSITLVDDSSAPHNIANGTWKNGSADASKEPSAPTVSNVQVNGKSAQSVGPFNSAGTFHLYCTIHPGMNLTVVVQ
jgi:plastocyanin